MPSVSARDALAYATTEAWMKLYAVLLAAWLLSLLGQFVLTSVRIPLSGVFGAILLLVATVLVVVWFVAAGFKLLVDTRQPAAEA